MKVLNNGMVKFVKTVWRRVVSWCVRCCSTAASSIATFKAIVTNLVFVGVAFLVIGSLISKIHVIHEHSVLVLQPKGEIVEQLNLDPSNPATDQVLAWRLVGVIERAARDKDIDAIMLRLDDLGASSIVALGAVRQALVGFKNAGKPIYAYANNYSQSSYYLASAASHVAINPMGVIHFKGLGVLTQYFGDAAKWAGVKVVAFKAGKYKSAVEPYVLSHMSEASKESYRPVLAGLWDSMLEDIGNRSKGLKPFLENLIEDANYPGFIAASDAKLWGMIDSVQGFESFEQWIAKNHNLDSNTQSFRAVTDAEYSESHSIKGLADRFSDGDETKGKIAVLVASGSIDEGNQPPGKIGSLNMVRMLRSIYTDDAIKALVLRIDSPGGSAIASDRIRDEIMKLKAKGVPVVVSMGGLCASGGYWIATSGDYLIANKNTVTGSIGVFGLFASYHDVLDKLKVTVDGVGVGKSYVAGRMNAPVYEPFVQAMQENVMRVYQRFLALVESARKGKLKGPALDVAEGRIWIARDALKNGLIDQIGTLDHAIVKAAEMAGLSKGYDVSIVEPQLNFKQMIEYMIMRQQAKTAGERLLNRLATSVEHFISMSGQAMAVMPSIKSEGVVPLEAF